ncbi:hypothetical protein F6X37_34840 [Paraburkholderia sp. 31.1]|uniref:hypothetical protein n=1 Tax=Paraburkholderia sp. 31.1 TaxID=2615205 RepID=UPI001655B832|nr:hypothetical protein [Paraburkholderia sp. 31.1]
MLTACPEAPKKIVTELLRIYLSAKAELAALASVKHINCCAVRFIANSSPRNAWRFSWASPKFRPLSFEWWHRLPIFCRVNANVTTPFFAPVGTAIAPQPFPSRAPTPGPD